VRAITGRYVGRTGTVDANVFQRAVDYPEEYKHLLSNAATETARCVCLVTLLALFQLLRCNVRNALCNTTHLTPNS
jgi:hypothetical protein